MSPIPAHGKRVKNPRASVRLRHQARKDFVQNFSTNMYVLFVYLNSIHHRR